MRRQEKAEAYSVMEAHPFPRTIYSLWLQGEAKQPDLVRLNLQRWASLNPEYTLRVLDADDVGQMVGNFGLPMQKITAQTLANIVRTYLLQAGGVWVDASLLPTRPLDDWLPAYVRGGGLFAFEQPGPDRPLSNWFLAAVPDHLIMTRMFHAIQRYWSEERKLTMYDGNVVPPDPVGAVDRDVPTNKGKYPYFWFHYLFASLLRRDPDFAAAWARCTKVSALAPHTLQEMFRKGQPSLDDIITTVRAAHVHKLDWRETYPLNIFAAL